MPGIRYDRRSTWFRPALLWEVAALPFGHAAITGPRRFLLNLTSYKLWPLLRLRLARC